MDLGTKHAAKLEPFLLMAKSIKGAAAAKLIQDATSAPGVFVFAELLELPNIQELKNSEQHAEWHALLQVFSYKTYQDYLQQQDKLPQLNPAQTIKLKHLSLVSLAASHRILPYPRLLSDLAMPSIRDLEDLIIDAIYLSLLRGKLDQKEQQLEVEYTMGRDLEPGKLDGVLAALRDWTETTQNVLHALDTSLSALSSHRAFVAHARDEHERAVSASIRDILDKQKEVKLGGRRVGGLAHLLSFGSGERRGGGGGGGGGGGVSEAGIGGGDREAAAVGAGQSRLELKADSMLAFSFGSVAGRGEGGGSGEVPMDVDDPESGKGKNKKAPQDSKQSRSKRNRF